MRVSEGSPKEISLFFTGICEKSYAKSTIINVIAQLKKALDSKGFEYSPSGVSSYRFQDVLNLDGCIVLRGPHIRGFSLYEYYNRFTANNFFSPVVIDFIEFLKQFINAADLFHKEMGSFPHLLLNEVYYDPDTHRITILPYEVSSIIASYYLSDAQKIVQFCELIIPGNKKISSAEVNDERKFTLSVIRLIYLFLSKSSKNFPTGPIYDIRNFLPDAPPFFADFIWNILHGATCSFHNLTTQLGKAYEEIKKGKPSEKQRLPLKRQLRFTNFIYRTTNFLSMRWKILFVIIIIGGVFIYIVSDAILKSGQPNYTLGLKPIQVIELYYKAVDDINVEVVDSLFYRKAGREIKNEISSLYVMKKMLSVYGQIQWEKPDNRDLSKLDLSKEKIYGIKDLSIKKISNSKNPVFKAKYKKVISSEHEVTEYQFVETIRLHKIKNHWYIVDDNRQLVGQRVISK